MPELTLTTTVKKDVVRLIAECGVRYWEDASVNGVEDTEGTLIPCRKGDAWVPTIDLVTGTIEGWPQGTTASIHYKVCDAGRYALLDAEGVEVAVIDGYVPAIMAPGDAGYGDYVIMTVGYGGRIADWRVVLEEFERAANAS